MVGVVVVVLVDLVPDRAWLCVSIREGGRGLALTWSSVAKWGTVVGLVDDGGGRRSRWGGVVVVVGREQPMGCG